MASDSCTGNSTTSAPSLLIVPVSAIGRGSAGSSVVRPSAFASGSKVEPWSTVEITTTKKAMLKYVLLSGTPSITGNVASTTGTPPRSPAQPSAKRSAALKWSKAVATKAATGRARATSTRAITVPSTQTSSSWLGNTSRPRVRKSPICATHASPWWKTVIVLRAGIVALPSTRPARYTARNPEPCRLSAPPKASGRGGHRRDRVEAARCEAHAAEGPDRREAHRQPDSCPDRQLLEEQPDHVG